MTDDPCFIACTMVPFVAGSVHWNYGDHVPFRKLAFEKAEMVPQILKRDGAEEFHFYNRTARNYKPFRLTTATYDYKLRVLLLD